MKRKKVCLIINPRAGKNFVKITDVLAVLSAAGWKTDIAIKEYGGHAIKLANKAAANRYDLIIGYGGDGTLGQVINGVLNTRGHKSEVGLIPGGTANVWAEEMGMPIDAVKAALSLVNSKARKVDVGCVHVKSLTFVDGRAGKARRKIFGNNVRLSSKARNHFLLMAGAGMDAAIMEHVSKRLKYEIGPLAVGLAAVKEVTGPHVFPVEIRSAGDGQDGKTLWKGDAVQVVIGNTRRYGVGEITPQAYIDDGKLDLCVIPAGGRLATWKQLFSLLARGKPTAAGVEYFRGPDFSISVPASIGVQLDGSRIDLKDYLSKSNWKALQTRDSARCMVNYHFGSMPQLTIAVPNTYDDSLFETGTDESAKHKKSDASSDNAEQRAANQRHQHSAEKQRKMEKRIEAPEDARTVKVVGVCPNPDKKQAYIVAGTMKKKNKVESKPVAVRIESGAEIISCIGETVPLSDVRTLKEADEILVEGKQNKRGVITAKRVVFPFL